MPLYFAYGSNMNVAAMAERCKGARLVGVARLMRHRFTLMPEGWASVERDMTRLVYGVLWDVSFGHIRILDAYEEIARGLYTKAVQPVLREQGGGARAIIYFGRTSSERGTPLRAQPAYMEDVVASARAHQFPSSYIRELEAFVPKGQIERGGHHMRGHDDAISSAPQRGVVRPRFATPFDRPADSKS
jgi:hypothetical protein